LGAGFFSSSLRGEGIDEGEKEKSARNNPLTPAFGGIFDLVLSPEGRGYKTFRTLKGAAAKPII
jgi:hypothetical protein